MARNQHPEVERWPQASDDGRWPEAPPEDDRWAAAQNRRRPVPPPPADPDDDLWAAADRRRVPATPPAEPDDEEWEAPSRRRAGRLRVEVPPIVNPYAIVALVAALIGAFPVAIVFAFVSFSYPRGRFMAACALLIGMLEVTVLLGVAALAGVTVPHLDLHRSSDSSASLGQPSVAPTQPTTTSVPITVTAATPVKPPSAAKGEVCTDAQVALIGTASDGSTLLCLHSSSGYRWVGPYSVSTAVHEGGGKCLPGTDKSARTSDGHALVCEGAGATGTWTLWVE
ncbi:preprotein translocase subunit SecD family protein [Nocardia aurantia]|uniref:DUF4190 domain-containing protein n=1 Tax=Nocardia aurantia TaxID=2585199 RepID=A0A7K0DMZ2_9NOCA|nr:hypothetical protein [Nocardia aurantia]MQY27116.1 hypothetical protein [Nocardia aurantia]